MVSRALSGSCTPGSSMMMRFSPERAIVGSATPSASMRPRKTSSARSVVSAVALTRSVSRVSKTNWVPPFRSRPSFGSKLKASAAEPIRTARVIIARQSGAFEPEGLDVDTPESLVPWAIGYRRPGWPSVGIHECLLIRRAGSASRRVAARGG